jgi:hypothetical protein
MKDELIRALLLVLVRALLLVLVILAVGGLFFIHWYIGGIHLDELKIIGMDKAKEICTDNIVEQGYQRSMLSGFGGIRWYQCNIDGNLFQFAITRRINSSEPQVYDLKQMTTFPSNFNIN